MALRCACCRVMGFATVACEQTQTSIIKATKGFTLGYFIISFSTFSCVVNTGAKIAII